MILICTPVELGQLLAGGTDLNQKLEIIMTQQQDIDTAVATVTSLLTDIQAQNAQLATDLTNLQAAVAAGHPVDTTKLNAIVSQVQATQAALDQAVQGITSLAPGAAPVTPPPAS